MGNKNRKASMKKIILILILCFASIATGTVTKSHFYPNVPKTLNIGSDANEWNRLEIVDVNINNELFVWNDANIYGALAGLTELQVDSINIIGTTITSSHVSNVMQLISNNAINIKPSGDTDNFIQFVTDTNLPYIAFLGNGAITAAGTVTFTDATNLAVTGSIDGTIGGVTPAAGTFTNLTVEGQTIIDVTNTEAFLVRKNADGGDVFTVDTTNGLVAINDTPTGGVSLRANLNGVTNQIQVVSSNNYTAFTAIDGQVGGAAWSFMSGFPAAGDFTMREGGVANWLTIKKTTGYIGINEASPQDQLEVNGTVLVKDKLKFTQDDGNEYIDSLDDGYVDYGATTGHRMNIGGAYKYTLPVADGNADEIIKTDGSGNLSFVRMPKAIYAELSDSTDQEFAIAGTPNSISFDTNDEIAGITHSVSDSNITIITTGVYTIFAQPQVAAAAGGAGVFHMWLQRDTGGGFADIANTNIELSLASNDEDVIPLATTFLLDAGDIIRLLASVSDIKIKLDAQTPAGEPAIPSIIFTMFMIGT